MPLPLLAVPLIAAGAIAAGKGIQSAVRANQAKKEIDRLKQGLVDPSYELPQELMSAYNRQLGMPTQMPGSQLARYIMGEDYSRAMGNASRAATSSQDLLSVATGLGEKQMMAGLDLAKTSAEYERTAEQEKMRGITQLAGQIGQYRDVMYRENELNPFLRTSAAISALREKRYKESNNTFNAFGNLAQTVASGIAQFGGGAGGEGGGGGGMSIGSGATTQLGQYTSGGGFQGNPNFSSQIGSGFPPLMPFPG